MNTKQHMRMEVKEISADGSFEGLLSVYNVVDLGKDLIEPGAFTKTIQEHGSQIPMLWQHKTDQPIGMLALQDTPEALRVKGQLLMELPEAQRAYLLIKSRIVKGLSIGFDTVKDAVENGVRHLKELRLWEGSIVTFPMCEQALISSVKARAETKEDFNTELAEIQLRAMADQMFRALQFSLCELPWASGLTGEQKVAAAEATIQQFSETFLAWLPEYIDYLTVEYGDMMTMGSDEIETKRMERKVGRTISAANYKKLSTAHDHMKSACDLLSTLIDTEAEDSLTSDEKAAEIGKPEPEPSHSAKVSTLLDGLRGLISAA